MTIIFYRSANDDDDSFEDESIDNLKEVIVAAARDGTLEDPNDWSDDDKEWSLDDNNSIEDETIDECYASELTSNAFILDLDNNTGDDDNNTSDDSFTFNKDEENIGSVKQSALSQFILGAFF